jgi:AAA+ superfamily predicted ATPase
MASVLLGESGKELIESEKFEQQFNQLAFYSNKYYSESNDQFFILFKCPAYHKIEKQVKIEHLDNLINKVSAKLPYTFKLKCKYRNEIELNEAINLKRQIINHFKILFEIPQLVVDENETLFDLYIDLQKAQLQAENQLFLNFEPESFQILNFGYESDEHIYLKYLAIQVLKSKPYNIPLQNIKAEVFEQSIDELTLDLSKSRPDLSSFYNNSSIVVEAETMRGKDFLKLTNEIIEKSYGWKGMQNFNELWLVFPGFEIARNYYQIQKCLELVNKDFLTQFKRKIIIKVFCPDLLNFSLIEVDFANIYTHTFEVSKKTRAYKSVDKPAIKRLGLQEVKGLQEEKTFLLELKSLIDNDSNIGIGGILFYGLPGCGKTYLAKSFAQELGWNFYTFSPADIATGLIGLAQKHVKDIFKQARAKSPSILFIDELDSIAFSRDNNDGLTVHSDQKATINQLLIELNNNEEHQVLVIGATNFLKTLDPAVKRTGRFDLKIPIYPPNKIERKEMLEFYGEKLNVELQKKGKQTLTLSSADFGYIATKTARFTSSDIKTIFKRPRIDLLLNKPEVNGLERIDKEVENMINTGQLSLRTEQVKSFITECEQNGVKSSKLEELKLEWGISANKIGFGINTNP